MLQLRKGLDAVFDVVYSGDKALCANKTDLEKFHETGEWSHIVCKEGKKPTVFKVRGLPRAVYQETFSGLAGEGQARIDAMNECLRYGIVDIENAFDGDQPVRITKTDTKHGKALDDKSLDLFTDIRLSLELVTRIRALSHVSEKHDGG